MTEEASAALSVCRHVIKSIVDDEEAVNVTASSESDDLMRLDVRVAKGEMGRVIGKRGRGGARHPHIDPSDRIP